MRKRQYQLNEDFFENITAPNQAYMLGLMYGDGCVSKMRNSYQIILEMTDRQIVEDFGSLLTDRPIRVIAPAKESHKPKYRLAICSTKMANDLISHGCIPQKSKKVSFPDIPKHLICHFIRGVFDADGCVRWRTDNNPLLRVNITTASECFARGLAENLPCRSSVRWGSKAWYVTINAQEDCVMFRDYLYSNAGMCLDRKRRLFYTVPSRTKTTARKKRVSFPKGSDCGSSKLSEKSVEAIKSKLQEKTNIELARDYGVAPSTISDIRMNRTWKHVNKEVSS